MKYPPPFEARTLFIDGPVAVTIHEAPVWEILDAYDRLYRLVYTAATNFPRPVPPVGAGEGPLDDRGGGPR